MRNTMSHPLDGTGVETCNFKMLCNQCIKVIVQKHDGQNLKCCRSYRKPSSQSFIKENQTVVNQRPKDMIYW